MTLQELKEEQVVLEESIRRLLAEFEEKAGYPCVRKITKRRWNGSNDASGEIVGVSVLISL